MLKLSEQQHIRHLADLGLLARQVVEGFITGLHQSPFHGFSVEFAEHRLYNNGESVKNIDWKLYARTEKLFVKQFQEETNLRCYLVLDTSSSMNFPEERTSKLEFSIYAIASLMYLLKRQRDAFGLCLFSDRINSMSSVRSTSAHLFHLYSELENAYSRQRNAAGSDITGTLHRLAEEVHKRSMIIVFSDMLENGAGEQQLNDLFAAIRHLRYNKHEVVIFQVNDRHRELEFDFIDRPHHFIDLETGEELRVRPQIIREAYRKSLDDYRRQLQLKCALDQVNLVPASVEDGYNPVLKEYLLRRNRMI